MSEFLISNGAIVNPAYNIIRQKTKRVRTRIQSLNSNDVVVGEVRGYCTGGTLDVTNQDFVRRSINMEFVANHRLEISQTSPFWVNKRLNVWTGVDDYRGQTHWFNLGIFVPTQIDTTAAISGRTIAFTGMDKMCLADNPFITTTRMDVNTPIADALKSLAKLCGEHKFMMDEDIMGENGPRVLNKDYEYLAGDNIQEAMKEIANLYMNFDVYYNTNGYLVYEQQKNRKNDAPIWDFSGSDDFTIQRQITADYTKIYNDFMVYGYYNDDTAYQPTYQITLEGDAYKDHPFSVENMGRKHSMVVEEDTYTTVEQCKKMAEYQKQQAENLINNFSITTVPIYQLNDVNRVVKVTDNGNSYTCLVDTISYPLDINSPMTIGCHEIFE